MRKPETTDPDWTEEELTDAEKHRLDSSEIDEEFYPDTEDVAEEMDLSRGDVFVWDDSPRTVVRLATQNFPARDRDNMSVKNPTVSNPRNPESRPVGVPIWEVYKDWKRGKVSPGKLTVTAE